VAVVMKADAKQEPVSVSNLEEDTYATPAIAGGVVYVRTTASLAAYGAR